MEIIDFNQVEDCIGSSKSFQIKLDEAWTDTLINSLSTIGKLDYYPEFTRPLFKLRGDEAFILKGVGGEKSANLYLMNCEVKRVIELLQFAISG